MKKTELSETGAFSSQIFLKRFYQKLLRNKEFLTKICYNAEKLNDHSL